MNAAQLLPSGQRPGKARKIFIVAAGFRLPEAASDGGGRAWTPDVWKYGVEFPDQRMTGLPTLGEDNLRGDTTRTTSGSTLLRPLPGQSPKPRSPRVD